MEMLDVLDRRHGADPVLQAERQRALIAELIAVQARVDAKFAALWDLETKLLARVRQGPPGTTMTTTTATARPGVATPPEPVSTVTPWQRLSQAPAHRAESAA